MGLDEIHSVIQHSFLGALTICLGVFVTQAQETARTRVKLKI